MMESMKPIITGADVQDMVRHHLGTQPNGYLGSDYGADVKATLQTPEATGIGDSFIAKMRQDVPVLTVMPSGAVNIYYEDVEPDRRNLIVDVAGQQISIG